MEPIEREIVDVVLNWSLTWTDWPTADSTSLREEAVRLLIRAGLLERRIAYSVLFTPPPNWWSRFRSVRSAERFELVVQISGHDWSKHFQAVLGKIFPSHWFDADKLVGRVDLHQTGSQVRLTDQGELAREHLEAGAFNNVLDYVLRRSLYDWYPKTTSHVDIVSRSEPKPVTLSVTANAMAVASANAKASVGDITTVINNGFDLSGIERALGAIAAALDKPSEANRPKPEFNQPLDEPKGEDDACKRPSMRRLSKGWRIEFEDEARDVDELVGFDFIAKLVNEAGNEVSTSQLLGNEDEPMLANDRHSKQDRWDGETQRAVADRIRQLEADIARLNNECADAERDGDELAFDESNKARNDAAQELQQIREQKREAINPKTGRSRELNRPNSKDHDNVRKRIDGARDHLKAKGLFKLHKHFVEFIQPNGKGSAYIYKPVPKVEWTVTFDAE